MQYNTIQHSTVQYSTLHYTTLQYNTIQPDHTLARDFFSVLPGAKTTLRCGAERCPGVDHPLRRPKKINFSKGMAMEVSSGKSHLFSSLFLAFALFSLGETFRVWRLPLGLPPRLTLGLPFGLPPEPTPGLPLSLPHMPTLNRATKPYP